MATELKDGTFSETKPFEEALEDFKKFVDVGEAVSFHVGEKVIGRAKDKTQLQNQIDEIKSRLRDVEIQSDQRNLSIHIPSKREILRYGRSQSTNRSPSR